MAEREELIQSMEKGLRNEASRAIKLRLERRKALQDLKTRLAADVKAVRERVDQEEASLNKSPKKVISKAKSEAKAKHEAEFVEFR